MRSISRLQHAYFVMSYSVQLSVSEQSAIRFPEPISAHLSPGSCKSPLSVDVSAAPAGVPLRASSSSSGSLTTAAASPVSVPSSASDVSTGIGLQTSSSACNAGLSPAAPSPHFVLPALSSASILHFPRHHSRSGLFMSSVGSLDS